MLTQYDEFPVHQTPYPFSMIPNTDVNWDDGYYHAVFSCEHGIWLTMSMRVNANTDILGGSIICSHGGTQYTIRLSREWRDNCDTVLGPHRLAFVEPFKHIRLTLSDNDSPLKFDIDWRGAAPAFLEDHHLNLWRGRATTDQSRYTQTGAPEGWMEIAGQRFEITPERWSGSRDHSWGLYEPRRPLAALQEYLPPGPPPSDRVLRFWTMFRLPGYSGFFSIREDKNGESRSFTNDQDGEAFEGAIDFGWSGERLHLAGARHELRFRAGTRMLTGGKLYVTDANGGEWEMEFEVGTTPFVMGPSGRSVGGWTDGGNIHTYHGPGTVMEWEATDISDMPLHNYGRPGEPKKEARGSLIYGARLKMRAPDGTQSEGLQHITCSINGDFLPYGLTSYAEEVA